MKKIISLIFIMAITPFFTGCSSSEDENPENDTIVKQNSYISFGTVYVSDEDKMLFFVIEKDGNATYCLSKNIMGYGQASVQSGTIKVQNEYTGNEDEIEVALAYAVDGKIALKGHLKTASRSEWEFISLTMSKSSEKTTNGLTGELWSQGPFHNINGEAYIYYQFTSKHKGEWRTVLAGSGALITKKAFHYIARNLQDTDTNGAQRTREISYFHNDTSTSPQLQTTDKEGSRDIEYWPQE